jgi:hypothetical protein
VTGNAGGNLLTTRTPLSTAASWSEVNGGSSVQITGVSCASPSRCAAVDNNGSVLVSSSPSERWAISNLIPFTPTTKESPPLNALFGASCPTEKLCALVGADGRIFTNLAPFSTAPTSDGTGSAGEGKRRRAPRRPRTTLVKGDAFREVTRRCRLKVRFRFYANGRVKGFVCKRDRGPYRRCRSPLRYRVGLGEHILRVRAIGLTGLRGPVAEIRFSAIHKQVLG